MSNEGKEIVKQEAKTPVPYTGRGVELSSLDEAFRVATGFFQSGLVPKQFNSVQAVFVAMQAGAEIGLSPWQSTQSIAVINGRTCVWGDAPLALCNVHPDFEDIAETIEGESDKMKAVCKVKRKGRTETIREFSVADAKTAKLWTKAGPWTDNPKRMLQLRARAFALRDSFPDALRGFGVKEEVEDYHEKPAQGRVVASTSVQLPDEPEVAEVPPNDYQPGDEPNADLFPKA